MSVEIIVLNIGLGREERKLERIFLSQ